MAVGTTAAIIAASVIAAGGTAIQGNQQKKAAGGRANEQRILANKKRAGEVAQQEADVQRARDSRAVEKATQANISGQQLQTQGISDDFGNLDVGALGATASNTATSTLNPIQPNTGA